MLRFLSRLTGGRLGAWLRARAVKRLAAVAAHPAIGPRTSSKLLAVAIAAATKPPSALS